MISSSRTCIDANIIVRLLVPQSSSKMLDLWDSWSESRTSICAPTLLQYEVSNALYQMVRHNLIDQPTAQAAIRAMFSLPVEFINHDDSHGRSIELASKYRIRASYDAHYLALSEHLGSELWTTDKKFFNAVQAECDWVRLVAGS